MLVEPTANVFPENNFNIIGQLYYSFSTIEMYSCFKISRSWFDK